MNAGPGRTDAQRGQILIVFTLALVAIVAMVGLIIDGGDTFVQRRNMQNVADAAAMAAAYSYTNTSDASIAAAAGTTVATQNGYATGVTVVVTPAANGATAVASVTLPHRNWFSGIVGFSSWQITTTASAITGQPTGVFGLMPIIVNQSIFAHGGGVNVPMVFNEPDPGQTNPDIPIGTTQFNWTNFCTSGGNSCNANTTDVNALIAAKGEQILVQLTDHINPLNAGAHSQLFTSLATVVGGDFPIAIVNDSGQLEGWAVLHLTGSDGGSTKQISGSFKTGAGQEFRLDPNIPVPPAATSSASTPCS
ncbi:MAG TPA: pilus assembly protein TadG-related protein [Propionibacteriaceae bacterium]